MLVAPLGLSSSFVCFVIHSSVSSKSGSWIRSHTAVRATIVALPQGSSLGFGLFCPDPSSLNRPHPPHSQAQRDFAAKRFIRAAFAVRERLGDPRVVPGFRCLFLLGMSSSKTPESSSTLLRPAISLTTAAFTHLRRARHSRLPPQSDRVGPRISGLPVSLPLQPAKLLASLSDPETFTSGLPAGRSPFPPPDMTTMVAGQPPPAGLAPAGTVTSLAAAQVAGSSSSNAPCTWTPPGASPSCAIG